MAPDTWLRKFFRLLNRSEADRAAVLAQNREYWKYLLFGSFALILTAIYAPPLAQSFLTWYRVHPDIAMPEADWRVIYASSDHPCGNIATDDPRCLANPANPKLWNSPVKRFDGEHEKRLVSRYGKDYWLGLTIPAETVTAARAVQANQFMVGHFMSSYSIWVDGVFVRNGRGIGESSPVILRFDARRMNSATPMQLAIHVNYDNDYQVPDHFCNNLRQGFLRQVTADRFITLMSFWERARPFSLLLSYALISVLFFFLWLGAPKKQEYFYMSLFALASAAWEARWTDVLFSHFHHQMNLSIGIAVRCYLSGFALLTALAFARVRSGLLRGTLSMVLFAPIALAFAADVASLQVLRGFLLREVTPICFFLGSLVCFAQAFALARQLTSNTRVPVRVHRLSLFGTGFLVASVYYFCDGNHFFLPTERTFWRGFEFLLFMLYFGAIALKEYAEDVVLVNKTPVSEYHRRPVLPDAISGAIMVADLKSSEPFYKQRAADNSGNLVSMWRSHFYTSVLKHGGVIINKKGDEVIAFFDSERCPNPAAAALRAIDDIAAMSELLALEFKRQDLFPGEVNGFFFRGSLSLGSIRPVWEEMAGGNREAYWEEAGNTSPFVEASRLLDLERKVPGTHSDVSLLVLREDAAAGLVEQFPELARKFIQRNCAFADKHGHAHAVAVYSPAVVARHLKVAA
ncbi:MAG: hypothetical protein HY074_11320 [Deltaproteobacteria bacterium]|nr:hypothetical protein [Deltaproteobacteria bacterium]